MKIIFAGTPEFAVAPLKALAEAGHEICAVLTQPDRPAGRGRKLTDSPVKQFALDKGFEVLQPESLKSDEIKHSLKQFAAEAMVVVAYGVILPQDVLIIPEHGCLNIHASLLPRWRGAAPVQRAIEAQDKQTGISIMQMDAGLDTGAVLYDSKTPISPEDTAGILHYRLAQMAAKAICYTLDNLANLEPKPQDEALATYAHKIEKLESYLDWSESAGKIRAKINAFNPWPVAQSKLKQTIIRIWQAEIAAKASGAAQGEIVKISKDTIAVSCGEGVLLLNKIQLPGKKAMAVKDFLNSRPNIALGDRFG